MPACGRQARTKNPQRVDDPGCFQRIGVKGVLPAAIEWYENLSESQTAVGLIFYFSSEKLLGAAKQAVEASHPLHPIYVEVREV